MYYFSYPDFSVIRIAKKGGVDIGVQITEGPLYLAIPIQSTDFVPHIGNVPLLSKDFSPLRWS